MHPINFPGAISVGKPKNVTDEQCASVWAKPHDYEYVGSDGQLHQSILWEERWKPSKEDLEALNRGESIVIHLHTGGPLIPVAIFTVDETGTPNDA